MTARRTRCVLRIEPLEARTLLSYAFTEIARTGTPTFSALGTDPSLNNAGTVAFAWVGVAPELSGISKGDGGPLTRIALAAIPGRVSGTTINDAGEVAYYATRQVLPRTEAVLVGDGATTRMVADLTGFTSLDGRPSVNYGGEAAFWGGIFGIQGIYKGDGARLLPVIETDGYFTGFARAPAISDGGVVAFVADFVGGRGIFTGDGASLTPIADTTSFTSFGDRPAINAYGAVAFHAAYEGGSGIFVGDGQTLTTIADTGGAFSRFSGGVAINSAGLVAFHAFLKGGGEGIFTGPDPVADRVLATGGLLFGQPATTFGFPGRGLNDLDQLAFWAARGAGPRFIVRADPETGGPTWDGGQIVQALPSTSEQAPLARRDFEVIFAGGSEGPSRAEVEEDYAPSVREEVRDARSPAAARPAGAEEEWAWQELPKWMWK